jgi:hypothetical protein
VLHQPSVLPLTAQRPPEGLFLTLLDSIAVKSGG